MNYEKIFMGSYNLHFIKTDKFKNNTIEVNFRTKIDNNITIRNLLKMVLLDSNSRYKKEKELVRETERLYDLKLITSMSRLGTNSDISFKVKFLDEKYTEKGMNEESILFFLSILFSPNIEDNHFNEEIVNKCKERLRKAIISVKDNKLKYALLKLLSNVKDMPYSNNPYGELDILDKIDGTILYNYYKEMLKTDLVDILIVGSLDKEETKNIFRNNFRIDTFKRNNPKIIVDELPLVRKPYIYKEIDDVNQTQLTMLYSLKGLTSYERKYVINLYSEILGGNSNSLLFDNVREKNSLCYYINSSVKAYDNVLFIYSGISNENVSKALKIIKKTMKDIESGKIPDNIFKAAKETIINGIIASTDNPSSIINTYYAHELVDSDLLEERIEKYNNITKEEVIEVSKKINLYEILTLEKGDNNEDN